MQISEHVRLADYTTLGVGGPARWLITATDETAVLEAVRFAGQQRAPLFVLGGGSNLLISDNGFNGVVLRIALQGIGRDGNLLRAGAGENWDSFVDYSVSQDLAGIECLAGIPGTVGGTPVQNVGAYGQEVSEAIACVRALDLQTNQFVEMSREQCGFAYRTSLFNTVARGRYIVTRVDFALEQDGAPSLRYADLAKHFADNEGTPTLREVSDAVRLIRARKGMVTEAPNADGQYPPRDADTCSAGSFFRNPIVEAATLSPALKDAPRWPAGEGRIKLPAAWLIEHAGFPKGYGTGAAGISGLHTLALVNRGGATASDVIALREEIAAGVKAKFGVELQQEPVSVGD